MSSSWLVMCVGVATSISLDGTQSFVRSQAYWRIDQWQTPQAGLQLPGCRGPLRVLPNLWLGSQLTTHRSEGLARTRLFHPWGREPERGWSSSGVPCRTLSDTVRGGHQVGSHWVPSGLVGARRGPAWVRTLVVHRYGSIESSVRARRILSGHVGHIGQSLVRSKNIKFGPK